jgi:UDP-glucose 4-epimerase
LLDSVNRVVVAGGAGFIGSHFVDFLMHNGVSVEVIDDLSSGRPENFNEWSENSQFNFLKANLEDSTSLQGLGKEADLFLHMAANPEIRAAEKDPEKYVKQHLEMTRNALDLCRERDIPNLVLASSSTVYGDATIFPTPEDYAPLNPVSAYGKMKLQCEELLNEACTQSGLRGLILRFANIIGPRSNHGVIYDLVRKLMLDPKHLEILGDGTQRKSYLYVVDCVEASLQGVKNHLASAQKIDILNIGNTDWILVSRIAEIVTEAMGFKGVGFTYKSASTDGRGWKGDVKAMRLDITRLNRLGWKPHYSSEEAVRLAAEATVSELKSLSA